MDQINWLQFAQLIWIAMNKEKKHCFHDKMKGEFFSSSSRIRAIVWWHYLESKKTLEEKVRWELHKDVTYYFEQMLKVASHNQELYGYLLPIWQSIYLRWAKQADTAGETNTNSLVIFSCGLLHMNTSVLADQQNLHLSSKNGNLLTSRGIIKSDSW